MPAFVSDVDDDRCCGESDFDDGEFGDSGELGDGEVDVVVRSRMVGPSTGDRDKDLLS